MDHMGKRHRALGMHIQPRTQIEGIGTEDRSPMLSTGTDIDTIDFMGEEYGIPGNSLTSGGLSPFGTAFAAARSRQEQENPNDPGGGRFMFDRKDDRGLREFHTGRADDLEADLRAGLEDEAAKRKLDAAAPLELDAGISDLDLTGLAKEEAASAAKIAAVKQSIEGEGTGENLYPRPRNKPIVNNEQSLNLDSNIFERASNIVLPENDLSVVKNSINMITQGADALVDGGVEVGGLLAQLLNLLLFSKSKRGENSDEINAVVQQLQGATSGKVFR